MERNATSICVCACVYGHASVCVCVYKHVCATLHKFDLLLYMTCWLRFPYVQMSVGTYIAIMCIMNRTWELICVYECVCLCTCVRMCVSVCGLLSGAGAVHRAWMARRLRAARGYTGTQGSLGNLLMCLYICMAQRNQ